MSQFIDWNAAWTATSIASSAVSNGGSATTGAISLDGAIACDISIECAYGGTATEGLKVYILRDIDGANFESIDDNPYGFSLAYAASVTRRKGFSVPAQGLSAFKVLLVNDAGASVTATVRYKLSTVGSA